MNIIRKYFPDLTPAQDERLNRLGLLYPEWNSRINVISRKDIENLYINHVLYSMAIARFIRFKPSTRVLDAGTGGGFPGIPLAILFPETEFVLVDSIAKKIRVVTEIARELDLVNVHPLRERFEDAAGSFDFVTGRAVTSLASLWETMKKKIAAGNRNEIPNGLLYLKGGDFGEELKELRAKYSVINVSGYFDESFFETKKIVHIYQG
jgi:16S rRNA (guanine527-N7)-methyltransferase